MRKQILWTVALILLFLAGGVYIVFHTMDTTKPVPSSSPTVSIMPSVLTYRGIEGKTALDLLQVNDHTAKTNGEGINAFVTTIKGYTANTSKREYWAFYVNGHTSDVGAGSYITKPGDLITWKIDNY